MVIAGKRILLGVCGSVAAYKAALLLRELRRHGADVRVVMTAGAKEFVTPLTFQALSGHPVEEHAFDGAGEDGMKHIALARWADMVLLAPATANVFAKLAHGLADDLLTMVCVAGDAPLVLAPAMNRQMWEHPATRDNVEILQRRGATLLGPVYGDQACGDTGGGRMMEPAAMIAAMTNLPPGGRLVGRRLVITAGPTHEAIDPVRYITNRSSGKMGFALAAAAASLDAEVILIAGPVQLETPANVRRVDVTSADEMARAALHEAQGADIFIGCAAVADYRPARVSDEKIKCNDRTLSLELVPGVDILKAVGAQSTHPFMVGFAAETERLAPNAKQKLLEKNLDIIFANRVGVGLDSGFDGNDNEVTAYWRGGTAVFDRSSKPLLAARLLELIAEHYFARMAVGGETKSTA